MFRGLFGCSARAGAANAIAAMAAVMCKSFISFSCRLVALEGRRWSLLVQRGRGPWSTQLSSKGDRLILSLRNFRECAPVFVRDFKPQLADGILVHNLNYRSMRTSNRLAQVS